MDFPNFHRHIEVKIKVVKDSEVVLILFSTSSLWVSVSYAGHAYAGYEMFVVL